MNDKLNYGYILRDLHGTHEGQRRIYKPRPYDDAQYYYAKEIDGRWYILHDNQLGGKEVDYDDLNDIADELHIANSTIKSRMVHN